MKKTAVIILSALVLLCLSFGIFAAGTPTFEVSSLSAKAGETADIKINIKNNPGITSAKLIVSFPEGITLKDVKFGIDTGMTETSENLNSPVTLNWFNYHKNYNTSDFLFATLKFNIAKDAKNGAHKVSISYDPDDVYNADEKNVTFKTVNGTITVSDGVEASSSSVSKSGDGEVSVVISNENENDKDTDNVASTATKEGVVTIGATDENDDEDYFEEEITEYDGEDVAVADGAFFVSNEKTFPFWIWAVVLAVLISGGVAAFLIIKKRRATKTSDK